MATEDASVLTSHERDALKDEDFALPGRRYPIANEAHARNALARVAQNGTPDEIAKVKAAVRKRYPSIAVDGEHASRLCYLVTPGKFQELSAAPTTDRPDKVAGQKATYLKKTVGKVGDYYHPTLGFHVPMPLERLKSWCSKVNEMATAGITIPIVLEDHKVKALNTMGYVKSASVNGDELDFVCQFIGDDAPLAAARNDASVGIDLNYIDGTGKNWGDAIQHLALTPLPVVPDLGNFQTINASLTHVADVDGAIVYSATKPFLGIPGGGAPEEPERTILMDGNMLPCSAADMDLLHQHIPGLSGVAPEQKMSHVARHLANLSQRYMSKLGLSALSGIGLDDLTTKILTRFDEFEKRATTSESAFTGATKKIVELSRTQPVEQPPELCEAIFGSCKIQLSTAVEKGTIDAATAQRFLGRAKNGTGEDAKWNMLLMSRAANSGSDKCLLQEMCEDLIQNAPTAPLGEKSGGQKLGTRRVLSRTVPDAGGSGISVEDTVKHMVGFIPKGRAVES